MHCVLPGWVAWLSTLVIVGGSMTGAMLVFSAIDGLGRMIHPYMTMGEQHSRSIWSASAVLLAIFVAFPVLAVTLASVLRPALCDVFLGWL
jgi:multisubunit Na+/H+ antiporter MnhG subunit